MTRISQQRLAIELRMACDAAMTVNPVLGPNAAAMRRVKRLLEDYPDALTHSHLLHNLGNRRVEWLRRVREARL